MPQLDIANSGLGSFAGKPMKWAGICCSVLPNGVALAKREERGPLYYRQLGPSGLEQKLTDRLDDKTYYTT
jgi:hypothetical protein